MDWTAYIILYTIFLMFYLMIILRRKKRLEQQRQKASLMREIPMISRLKCPKCGNVVERQFKHYEYVVQEVEKCPKCKKRKMVVEAIYHIMKKTPRQEAEEKIFEERWK